MEADPVELAADVLLALQHPRLHLRPTRADAAVLLDQERTRLGRDQVVVPSGPLKYEAGQLLKLAREHCGAEVCDDEATTAVAAEVPLAEPTKLDAVTVTRKVLPTSVEVSR